jgi:hypothetical protein
MPSISWIQTLESTRALMYLIFSSEIPLSYRVNQARGPRRLIARELAPGPISALHNLSKILLISLTFLSMLSAILRARS